MPREIPASPERGWIKLHRALLNDPTWGTATAEQKVVLITILLRASHEPRQWMWEGRKFTVQPGQLVTSLSSLAGSAGLSIQNVRSAITRFEKLGFLTNESAKNGRLITITNWGTYQGTDSTPNTEINKDPTKAQQLSRKKEIKKTPPLVGFDQFWQAYPKKVGKTNAIKSWQKIYPDPELLETILAALDCHKRSEGWQKDNGQFIPHPATWLNQQRWEDELSHNSTPGVALPANGMRVY